MILIFWCWFVLWAILIRSTSGVVCVSLLGKQIQTETLLVGEEIPADELQQQCNE